MLVSVAHQAAGFDVFAQRIAREQCVTGRQRDELPTSAEEEWVPRTSSAPAPALDGRRESRIQLAFTAISRPGFADRWRDLPPLSLAPSISSSGWFVSPEHGDDGGFGTSSCSSPSRLAAKSVWVSRRRWRCRLAGEAGDKAPLTGSKPVVKTIGTVAVAALTAGTECRWQRSRPPVGGRFRPPYREPAHPDPRPSDIRSRRSGPRYNPISFRPWRNAPTWRLGTGRGRGAEGTRPLASPSASRAPPSGHAAAAPPSSVMNSRRLMGSLPQARGRTLPHC